jgi:threonine/homoserine efflux transporter RhtA
MAIVGLLLIFLSGQGMENYEQVGYLLAFQANIILCLNALLSYYYRNKLGG